MFLVHCIVTQTGGYYGWHYNVCFYRKNSLEIKKNLKWISLLQYIQNAGAGRILICENRLPLQYTSVTKFIYLGGEKLPIASFTLCCWVFLPVQTRESTIDCPFKSHNPFYGFTIVDGTMNGYGIWRGGGYLLAGIPLPPTISTY